MGGGGSSGGCCGNCSQGGSTNPSNKPQPPRTGGKYTTKPLEPVGGVPTLNTGCACSANRDCPGGTYKWEDAGGCGPTAGRSANCANGLPFADMCPAIGTVTQTDWSGHQVVCKYNNSTIPFNQLSGYFDETNANMIRGDRCTPLNYSQLASSTECLAYYGALANSELLKRVEATNGAWVNDAPQRDFVQQIVADEVLQGHPSSDVSSRAKRLISDFCDANPNDPKCGCYNAINKGLTGCQAAADGTPGCAELKALGIQFDNAPNEFKPIFQNMKNQVNAMCLAENCKTVRGSTTNAAGILLPGTVPGGDCSSNFNVCLTKLTVGQMTGGNIDSSCKQTFNLPATSGASITTGPGGTQGGAAGGSAPGSTITGGGAGSPEPDVLFKDPTGYLDTKNKQYGAIGGLIFIILCCCCVFLLLAMGGEEAPKGPDLATLLAVSGS